MKANKVPEKLYFGVADKSVLDIYSTKERDDEIEYTRTDAFIEKAVEFFGEHLCEYIDIKNTNCDTFVNIDGDRIEEDFRKYMKEE